MICDKCNGKKIIRGWGCIDATCYKCSGAGVIADTRKTEQEMLRETEGLSETKRVEFENQDTRFVKPAAPRGRPVKAL